MNKKLIATLLSAALFVVTALPLFAYAEEPGTAKFFLREIVINGAEINNYNLSYPFVLYGDATYLPLTPEIGEICGFNAELDRENNIVRIRSKTPTAKNLKEDSQKNEGEGLTVSPLSNPLALKVIEKDGAFTTGVRLDLGGNPIVMKDGVPYMPLRSLVGDKGLGWSLSYDPYFGVCVSTDPAVPATKWFKPEQARYNKGLTDYILERNKSLRPSLAQDYVFLFKRAAKVNAIDVELLMAMAQLESNFNFDARSSAGARGLMQIMPATGALLGLSPEQLYDPRLNIFYGAAYFKTQLNRFNNNVGMAISAYAKGPTAVSRGAYSRGYVEKISNTVGKINLHMEGAN